MFKTCVRSSQANSQHGEWRWGYNYISCHGVIGNYSLLEKKDMAFTKNIVPGKFYYLHTYQSVWATQIALKD